MPAPKGKGLIADSEIQKVLKLAGIQDAWTKSIGQTKTKFNLIYSVVDALKKLMAMRVTPEMVKKHTIIEGRWEK